MKENQIQTPNAAPERKENEIEVYISGRGSDQHDSESKAKARQKARERRNDVIITPAIPEEVRRQEKRGRHGKLRVAAYCRVSTPNEAQVSSIENQKEYFTNMAAEHDDWGKLMIFADEGVSGTNRRKRKEFNRMIDMAMNGQIDYIVIKDIPRFSRNLVDAVTIARDLRNLEPPVGIFFDALNFSTLREDWDVSLTMMSMTSQWESKAKSDAMNWSYKHRFSEGRLLCPTFYLLGYTTTEDGKIAIVEDEARIIRLMYSMLIVGYSPKEIAQNLTDAKIHTGWHSIDSEGNEVYNTHWNASSVCNVLRNEKYMGGCRCQKGYTVDYIEHKRRINKGKYPTYYIEKHHDPIVTKEVWELAQKILLTSAYLRRGKICRDNLSVIKTGLLRGFVTLNSMRAGFDLWDYFDASDSVGWDEELKEVEISGAFGFEVLRTEFTDNQKSPQMTIDKRHINFNIECNRFFENDEYVELLLHPGELLLAVRSASCDNPNAIRWSDWTGGTCRHINPATGIIPAILYDLMNWNEEWKFKGHARGRRRDGESVLIFDLTETAAFIPKMAYEENGDVRRCGWYGPIFPKDWEGKVVGDTLLENITKCRMHLCDYFDIWDVSADAEEADIRYKTEPISAKEVKMEIDRLREFAVS